MTRDEAIEIEKKKLERYKADIVDIVDIDIYRVAAANIDALIELGLLKVDEPAKTIKIRDQRFTIGEIDTALFMQNVGYKVVKL